MRRVAAAILALLVALPSDARADDVRPVSLDVRETAPGRYEVRFQTPMRGRARLRARPRLPQGAKLLSGTYDRQVAGDSSIERFAFELAGGLVGHEIGVDGLALGSRNAILRVRLRDGRNLRAVLGGTRPVLRVEPPPDAARAAWTVDATHAARQGLRHGVLDPAHLLLALGLMLAAKGGGWVLALALFLLLDLAGAWLGLALPPGLRPTMGLADAVVSLTACLAAREALHGRARRLALLAALAGLVHGLAVAGQDRAPVEVLGRAFGLDLAHLGLGGAALLALSVVRRPAVRRVSAWTVGVLAVAVAAVSATRPTPSPAASTASGVLPTALAAAPAAGATVRSPGLVTDLEAYLDVGVFGARLEILSRLETLQRWLGPLPTPSSVLPVAEQPAVLNLVADSILARLTITIDGETVAPDAVRRGFAVQEPTGTYIRDEPVPEDLSKALVGVVYALPTPSIPKAVEVRWSDLPPGLSEVRARVIDPELSREIRISTDTPSLTWKNTLREDPLPPVETIRVRRQAKPLPLFSLGLLGAGLALAWHFSRRRTWAEASVCPRLGTALAFLALPILTVDIDVGGRAAPTPREARAITSALLDNMYLALNVREEEAVYDRLALSLTEATRTAAYMANRRALAFARVGGARTHVDVVELVDLDDVRPQSDGGFEASARWTVAGSVTHFGHRHLRQNLYVARLGITPSDGTWKINVFEVQDVARQR